MNNNLRLNSEFMGRLFITANVMIFFNEIIAKYLIYSEEVYFSIAIWMIGAIIALIWTLMPLIEKWAKLREIDIVMKKTNELRKK